MLHYKWCFFKGNLKAFFSEKKVFTLVLLRIECATSFAVADFHLSTNFGAWKKRCNCTITPTFQDAHFDVLHTMQQCSGSAWKKWFSLFLDITKLERRGGGEETLPSEKIEKTCCHQGHKEHLSVFLLPSIIGSKLRHTLLVKKLTKLV